MTGRRCTQMYVRGEGETQAAAIRDLSTFLASGYKLIEATRNPYADGWWALAYQPCAGCERHRAR